MAQPGEITLKLRLEEATVQRLGVEPGDVLVVKVPETMAMSDWHHLRDAVCTVFENAGIDLHGAVIIVPADIQFEIVHKRDLVAASAKGEVVHLAPHDGDDFFPCRLTTPLNLNPWTTSVTTDPAEVTCKGPS